MPPQCDEALLCSWVYGKLAGVNGLPGARSTLQARARRLGQHARDEVEAQAVHCQESRRCPGALVDADGQRLIDGCSEAGVAPVGANSGDRGIHAYTVPGRCGQPVSLLNRPRPHRPR